MELDDFVQDAIGDRLEGWELVEFLQVPIESIVLAALENDWINDENVDDVLELIGLRNAD
jgi:hypothetical protein